MRSQVLAEHQEKNQKEKRTRNKENKVIRHRCSNYECYIQHSEHHRRCTNKQSKKNKMKIMYLKFKYLY